MTDRGVSTAIDTVLAVSLVAAAVTAVVVLTPPLERPPPDAAVALDALLVTTAAVDAPTGSVRATVATHLASAARSPPSAYVRAVVAVVERRLRRLRGRASVVVVRNGTVLLAAGPAAPPGDVNAATLPLGTDATVVLRRWWA